MTKVINFFAGPGTGKSTLAAGTFYKMKQLGMNVELIGEFAKEVVWEGHHNLLEDQLFITANQNRRLQRLIGKVDYIVCDSPVILGVIYAPDDYKALYNTYITMVRQLFESYNNINYFITRSKAYNTAGRYQTYDQAVAIDVMILDMLLEFGIPYSTIDYNNPNVVEGIIAGLEE